MTAVRLEAAYSLRARLRMAWADPQEVHLGVIEEFARHAQAVRADADNAWEAHVASAREYERQRRQRDGQWRRAVGRCRQCPADVVLGLTLCRPCLDAAKARAQAVQAARVAAGYCVVAGCPREHAPGRLRCQIHLDRQRVTVALRRAEM